MPITGPMLHKKNINKITSLKTHCRHVHNSQNKVSEWNQVPPVLSSNDRLMKVPKDLICWGDVGFRICFKIVSAPQFLGIILNFSNGSDLKLSFILQYIKKWDSSSKVLEILQSLNWLGIFLYLIVSMANGWSQILN